MTTWAVWAALRKLPREAWIALAFVFLAVGCYAAQQNALRAAYERGKRDAAQGVSFDSALVAQSAAAVALRTAHTDTVTRTVVRTRWQVDTLIRELPPEIAALPPVDTLVRLTQSLLVQMDSLGMAHTAERAAWTERAKVDSAAIYALRILGTARGDTIATLRKRPRWRTVVVGTLTGAATGAAAVILRR